MKFNYKQYGEYLRPVIPVIISNGGKEVEYQVLVDSGADKCVFDAEIGRAIGITVENSEVKKVFGIGGKIVSYYSHPVKLKLGKHSFQIEAGFMPAVTGGIVPYGFAGQKGFFDKFIVKFDYKKEEVELTKRK